MYHPTWILWLFVNWFVTWSQATCKWDIWQQQPGSWPINWHPRDVSRYVPNIASLGVSLAAMLNLDVMSRNRKMYKRFRQGSGWFPENNVLQFVIFGHLMKRWAFWLSFDWCFHGNNPFRHVFRCLFGYVFPRSTSGFWRIQPGRAVAYSRENHFAYARVTFGKSNKPKAPENPKRCFGTNTSLCMLALTFGPSP